MLCKYFKCAINFSNALQMFRLCHNYTGGGTVNSVNVSNAL